MRVEEGVDTNGPTEAVILWSVSEGVVDVADELCDFSSSASASDSSFADPQKFWAWRWCVLGLGSWRLIGCQLASCTRTSLVSDALDMETTLTVFAHVVLIL